MGFIIIIIIIIHHLHLVGGSGIMFCLLEARSGVLGPDSRHFRVLDEPSPHQLSPPARYAMATSPRAANNHCAAATRDATCTTFTTPIQAFQPVTATINRACPDVGIVPWAPPTKTNRRTDDIHIGQLAMVCLILHYCISYAPCLQLPHLCQVRTVQYSLCACRHNSHLRRMVCQL